MKQYQRWQKLNIQKALKKRRVVIIGGPRQCGKTTLAQELATKKTPYRTLDDVTLLNAALNDPHSFVAHGNELLIIDEVQRAPILLQAIKQEVDSNKAPGRFLLTGSANIQSLPGVKESLAGRVRKLRLRPLAQGEIRGCKPSIISNLFSDRPIKSATIGKVRQNKNDYVKLALKGGFPEALSLDTTLDKRQWHEDYTSALIERDLHDIINIRRQDSMVKLIEVLATWSSKFMDISKIGSYLSLSRPAIESYINALEALYLIERVRPWFKSDYDRVSKQDKLFMTDTGLMSSTLKWTFDEVQFDGDKNGKLIETFIFNELMANIDSEENSYQIFHYRDRNKREIDFIIEDEADNLLGIEVKAGSIISKDSFKHLHWFKKNAIKNKSFKGIVFYTGEEVLSFGDNMWAVPINSLWAK